MLSPASDVDYSWFAGFLYKPTCVRAWHTDAHSHEDMLKRMRACLSHNIHIVVLKFIRLVLASSSGVWSTSQMALTRLLAPSSSDDRHVNYSTAWFWKITRSSRCESSEHGVRETRRLKYSRKRASKTQENTWQKDFHLMKAKQTWRTRRVLTTHQQ